MIFVVGYGDIYPETLLGRFVTLGACILGTLLISLMVVSLTNTTELTTGEARVYDEIVKYQVKKFTRAEASKLLFVLFSTFMLNKKLKDDKIEEDEINELMMKKFGFLSKLKNQLKIFKSVFKKFESYSSSAEDSVIKMNERAAKKIEYTYSCFQKVGGIERKCRRICNDQKEIKSRVEEFTIFQECITNFLIKVNSEYRETEI